MVLKQAKKYENMLNSCLIERLTEETRFQPLINLLGALLSKSDEIFYQNFDKVRIQQRIAEAESSQVSDQEEFTLETHIATFWESLETRFMSELIS